MGAVRDALERARDALLSGRSPHGDAPEQVREGVLRAVEAEVARSAAASLRRVINATGMGKDIPGSPITDAGLFPKNSIAWEFNYRGELDFMHQALRQVDSRNVTVEDGWVYFLHGWSQVVAQVLHVELNDELFAKLNEAAMSTRK